MTMDFYDAGIYEEGSVETITVSKNQLLDALRLNRDEHITIFDKAVEVYKERVIEELEKSLADARAGRKISRYISLPEPENHTADFDTAIKMLEWEQGDTIELERRDFMRYVENRWEWAASFAGNTQAYLAE